MLLFLIWFNFPGSWGVYLIILVEIRYYFLPLQNSVHIAVSEVFLHATALWRQKMKYPLRKKKISWLAFNIMKSDLYVRKAAVSVREGLDPICCFFTNTKLRASVHPWKLCGTPSAAKRKIKRKNLFLYMPLFCGTMQKYLDDSQTFYIIA